MFRLSRKTIANYILVVIWLICALIDSYRGENYGSVIYKLFAAAVFCVFASYYLLIDLGKIKPIPKKKETWGAIITIGVVIAVVLVISGNYHVETNRWNVKSDKIPEQFDGFRIAQVSDLHNTKFDHYNSTILEPIFHSQPDIIVITGDMIDSRRTKIDRAVHLADRLTKIAPTYYVNGNHESRLTRSEYTHLITRLEQAGVVILENHAVEITLEDKTITLIGINDPCFGMKNFEDTIEQNVAQQLQTVVPENDNYKILLAHRPEHFDIYAGKVDLVLSGHAHGGQWRIPFVGGVIAPGQGFLPKYDQGSYQEKNTEMLVSRGLGNSLFPFRLNNKPEVVIAELTKIAK